MSCEREGANYVFQQIKILLFVSMPKECVAQKV